MNTLCLDVKIYIALKDAYTWLKLYTYDDVFKTYASSGSGINMFIRSFLITNADGETKLEILDLLHNVDDLPAYVSNMCKKWYCMGKVHRGYDLPAIIWKDGGLEWFFNNKHHRDNDLPAIIDGNRQQWFVHGKRHRENDLPAIIDGDEKHWYYNGKLHRDNDLPVLLDKMEGC